MSQLSGLVTAAAQNWVGSQSVLFRPKRSIGNFTAQVTISETHTDEMEITDQPVELGAAMSDHAFMRPQEVTIKCLWSDSPAITGIIGGILGAASSTVSGVASLISGTNVTQSKAVYDQLLLLQQSRIPFDVVTGKRKYTNMLIKSMRVETSKETENALMATLTLRQVILVSTQVLPVPAPASAQDFPSVTAASVNQGGKQLTAAPNFNLGSGSYSINPGG